MTSDAPLIEPAPIAIADEAIEDLRRRLRDTRWPEAFDSEGRDYGIDTGIVHSLCDHWERSYDWRETEAALNRFESYRTEIDGAVIQFLHARSKYSHAMPLLLLHGWPGSVVDFIKVIDPLIDPIAHGGRGDDAFHVICPSLPGFGFSGATLAAGWDPKRMAHAMANLVDRLGYRSFIAQGGDWGSTIATWMGSLYPDRLVGVHLNTISFDPDMAVSTDPTVAEARALDRLREYIDSGAGYAQIQGTRPNTIGMALDNSPAGLCAWIVEKYQEWSDCGGDPRTRFTVDELLSTASVYWFTRTAASSGRLYRETRLAGTGTYQCPRIEVPTGCALYPAEIAVPSRAWVEHRYNVVHWAELPEGGHFAAYEVPDIFVNDLRSFSRMLEGSQPEVGAQAQSGPSVVDATSEGGNI